MLLNSSNRFGDLLHAASFREQHVLSEPNRFLSQLFVLWTILITLKPILELPLTVNLEEMSVFGETRHIGIFVHDAVTA